jgi:SAM-dependent methyltransferase
MRLMKLDEKAKKYLRDIEWVQKDIWKVPAVYPEYKIDYCEVFAPDIPFRKYSDEEKEIIKSNLKDIHMIMQGPFWLGEDIIVGGFWNENDTVRSTFGKCIDSLEGKRCLEIGSMSGYQSFFLNLKNPEYYLAIEPSGYHYQAEFLNSIYKTKIDFKQWFWQDIPTEYKSTFDLVLNCGCLYHEYDFVSMIKRTTELLKVGGKTIVATTTIKDKKHSDCIKYMPDVYTGDMTYWFAIGEKTLFRLFESFGCEGQLLFRAGSPGDSGNGMTVEGYPLENYNFYEFTRVSNKVRPTETIPRY